MNRNRQGAAIIAAASLLAAGIGIHHYAQAQGEAPAAPPGQGFPGGGGGGGRFGGGFGGFGGGGTQMAVSGNSLFVLRGGTIYRINTPSLAVEAKGDLPMPTPQAGGFRGGNFRGAPQPPGGDQGAPPAAPGADNGAPPPAGN